VPGGLPDWKGVYAALTTAFAPDGAVDADGVAAHADALVAAGCRGLVALGSLGEGATLAAAEKADVLRAVLRGAAGRVPVVAGIGALSTAEAVALAREAARLGCAGLMVLPPYAYSTDAAEMGAHVGAVVEATDLPSMLYNNPAAYRTDFLPADILRLAAVHPRLRAVKESSGDARRITALRSEAPGRLALLAGLDDAVVEGVAAGADGWVAGLVNAFPAESVALLRLAVAARGGGPRDELEALQRWFLPLLRLDGLPKFVQHIKLAQEMAGRGRARLRPPRLPLAGEELRAARALIAAALESRPRL
jgi:dihydrodipicolinate synthase/N-acetylneuraminate lyase